LSKSSSKKEVLENYITTLIREREKLKQNEKKRKNASNQDDLSESEDDMSVNQIEALPMQKGQGQVSATLATNSGNPQERLFRTHKNVQRVKLVRYLRG